MIPRQLKLELLTIVLYAAVIAAGMDKDRGFRAAATILRWYANRCIDLGNWAWYQALRADAAYKELITP